MIQVLKCGVFVSFLFVVFIGCGPDERGAMIGKLEVELAKHAARTDSLVVAANALTERVQRLSASPDSIQNAKQKLMVSKLRLQNATLEYHQGLIQQNLQIEKLRAELNLMKEEPERSDTKAQLFRADIETLYSTLRTQYQTIIRLEENINKESR